jgi:hypothetical protein
VTDFLNSCLGSLQKGCRAFQIVRHVDEYKAWVNITPKMRSSVSSYFVELLCEILESEM